MSKIPEYYPGMEYQQLFDHMYNEHGLILLESEMDEIIEICNTINHENLN